MANIPLSRISDLTGIQMTKSEIQLQCPLCGTGRAKKLYFSTTKGIFCCQKCGAQGGFIQFVALMALGTHPDNAQKGSASYLEARELIYGKPNEYLSPRPQKIHNRPPIIQEEENKLASDEVLDETYRALLAKLSLREKHKQNLFDRGLSMVDIEEYLFKSTPQTGLKDIASSLRMEDACTLEGVPGFYKVGTSWCLVQATSGIFIPVYKFGKIVGLQVRDDSPQADPRYKWFSSTGKTDGTKAAARVGCYGYASSVATLIEGPMKSFIAHKLGDNEHSLVVSIPGVNSLSRLDEILNPLRGMGMQHIRIAFDMDWKTNPNVERALEKLKEKLKANQISYDVLDWDSRYKGIDDYLLAKKTK